VLESEEDRKGRTIQLAWWAAMSGEHSSWQEVETHLFALGYEDASRWLADAHLRQRLAETCEAARSELREGLDQIIPQSAEDRIWRVVLEQHAAYWMRDLAALEKLYVHAPYARFWAQVGPGGATLTEGWDAFAETLRLDLASAPERNPLFAYRVRFEKRSIRVGDDMALVTFDAVFPTADMPGFHGPETAHQMIVFERAGDAWLMAAMVVLDDQFGQTDVPIWEVDETGHIIRRNPAAMRHVETESETDLRCRGGRIHLSDPEADRRLYEAIQEATSRSWGRVMATNVDIPIVVDPGNDLPARIWWAGRRGKILYVAFNDWSLIASRVERAASAYGLSPAQRRLTASIVAGDSLTDAARREGIRVSTARTQLQRTFDKVGVRTQPALVRALLAVTGPR
jgi:DNA-binding CsgD family transcriptional regulator/PAS domain-containing protein